MLEMLWPPYVSVDVPNVTPVTGTTTDCPSVRDPLTVIDLPGTSVAATFDVLNTSRCLPSVPMSDSCGLRIGRL